MAQAGFGDNKTQSWVDGEKKRVGLGRVRTSGVNTINTCTKTQRINENY